MNIHKIDDAFAIAGQIQVADLKGIAEAGYKGIVCARPDDEDPGQPSFAEIAAEAERQGLKAVHIPVSGMLGEGQLIRFEAAMAELERPVLGYCRSGGRAGSLYAAISE